MLLAQGTELSSWLVNTGLGVGLGFVVVVSVVRGWFIPRKTHEEIADTLKDRYTEMRADRDYWRSAALGVVSLTERAVSTTEQVVAGGNGGHADVPAPTT